MKTTTEKTTTTKTTTTKTFWKTMKTTTKIRMIIIDDNLTVCIRLAPSDNGATGDPVDKPGS